jgi:DNA-binding NarL/FixJ family response regulator
MFLASGQHGSYFCVSPRPVAAPWNLRQTMPILSLDHVQLAIPGGGEERARSFYSGILAAALPAATPASQSVTEWVEPLTRREREVLQMLAAGLANKEIANRLHISDHTAKFHVASILGKLGAASRAEAVTQGIRRGLVLL